MGQPQLMLRGNQKRDVSDDVIRRLPTFKDALRLTKDVSGLNDQQIAQELGIDPAQWSRIWTAKGHFPPEKLTEYMDICENIIPLRWLALHYGFELRPILSIVEIERDELRIENAQLKRDMATITSFLRNAGLSIKTGTHS